MNLDSIKNNTTWEDAATAINSNFSKTNLEVAKIASSSNKHKGFFTTEAALLVAQPYPRVGDNAYVGATYPGVVYVCNTTGVWTATATVPSPPAVNISEYYKKTETVTYKVPLAEGYYNIVTAADAVPIEIRKYGLIVIYESAAGIWEKMQFKGVGNNITFEWNQPIHWVKDDSLILDLNYMYDRTYDSKESARNIVPVKYRRYGLILQYRLDNGSRFFEQYIGSIDYLLSDSWYGSPDFRTVHIDGSINDMQKESLLLNQYYINGVFNASVYKQKINNSSYDFPDKVSARNIIPASYRVKGLVITYYNSRFAGIEGNGQWVSERFIGDDITNPNFYSDDTSWIYTENYFYVNMLADARINENAAITTPDISNIKFLLPDKMYFVKGRKLPFYRESMFLDTTKDRLKNWEISINSVTSKNEGLCHIFGGSLNLDGNEVGYSIDLSIRKIGTTHPYYGKLISANIVDPITKTGLTPKILMIGDSITNRYIPFKIKAILESYGVIPTMLGTMTNLGGEKAEGRENWTLSNLLGWENMWGRPSDNQAISPSDADATTLYQNPFLKLADTNDKTYYPDFCFRSTGAKKELSYTEDSDKTGNFYIFSFNKYVTTNLQGNVPNIVTIALGTNDASKGYAGFYPDATTPILLNSRYWKALNFIITNITENYPAIKIGIVPQYARFDDYMWIDGAYSTGLIQSTILNIRTKNNVNINVVGVWNNVNRYYGSNGKLRTVLDSDMSVDTVSNNGDTFHYDDIGQSHIANSLACYILNQI